METITDILNLPPESIQLLKNKFPECKIAVLSFKHFQAKIYILLGLKIDTEKEYYNFLVDNLIAMGSIKFRSRLISDEKFSGEMLTRASLIRGDED